MNPLKLLILTSLILTVTSCKKEDTPPDPNVIFKAALSGASESSPNTSTATGSATVTYNKVTKIFTLTATYSGFTATAGHIHKAPVGTAGPIVFPLPYQTSPVTYTSPTLDATQEADLMNGLYYVNFHSSTFPAGEIRGQLLKQ